MTDAFQQDYWQQASTLGPLRAVIDPRDVDGDKNRAIHQHHHQHTQRFLDTLPLIPHQPVLDLGCGTGRHRALLERYGRPCIGIDRSPGMLAHTPTPRPPLVCADLTGLPLADASIGLAFSFWVFQHLTDDDALRAAARRLRLCMIPGGCLAMTERSGTTTHEPGQDERYIRHRDAAQYQRLFESVGWTLLHRAVMPPARARPAKRTAPTQEVQYAFCARG